MSVKDYEGEGIVVHWDAERCWHSGRCVSGAPEVFDPQRTPWIVATARPADELAEVIDMCPSGALSYTRTDGAAHGRRGHAADEDPTAARRPDDRPVPEPEVEAPVHAPGATAVTPRQNGPLVVEGTITLIAPDGSSEELERAFLCRCGGSGKKPFCDGTHQRIGFEADGVAPARKP